jgi:hypothetical protein
MNPLNEQIGGNHYKDMAIQPVEYTHKNKIGFIEGCIIKYISRYKNKNGRQDLEKARHFIDVLIEMEYPDEKTIIDNWPEWKRNIVNKIAEQEHNLIYISG